MLPYINGDVEGEPHESLFWRRHVAASVLRGPWKLIRVATNPLVLVNLEDDPGETTNLVAEHPDIVARLLQELETWEAGLTAPLWVEGERWERNQIRKHQMDVVGREMERDIP